MYKKGSFNALKSIILMQYFYDISVVIPCLNEANTIGRALEKVFSTMDQTFLRYEVIVADNGSTDGTLEILKQFQVHVLHVREKGYGNALRGAFAAAQGEWIFYGDADLSYDFSKFPDFWEVAKEGIDMVAGSRLQGTVEHGAMPWLHRYIGTPMLTWLINILYKGKYTDCNSGMRLVRSSAVKEMHLQAKGMEMSSEMYVKALKKGYTVKEIPMDFYRDKRGRAPHLRTMRDGCRNAWMILSQL